MNPKKSSKKILIEVLTIIDYKDNKEIFISKFLKLCIQKALMDILLIASDNNKKEIIKLSEMNLNPEELERKLKDTVGENLLNSSLEKATEEVFTQYLESIYSTLSNSQNESLHTYLNSI